MNKNDDVTKHLDKFEGDPYEECIEAEEDGSENAELDLLTLNDLQEISDYTEEMDDENGVMLIRRLIIDVCRLHEMVRDTGKNHG